MLGNRAIDNRVSKLMELEEQVKELERQMDAIKAELKDDMTEKGLDEIETKHYKIRWKEVASNRFDTTNFKKDFADLYKRYIKKSSYRRFTVAA